MQTYHIKIDDTGKELDRHGAPDFPLAVYTTRLRKNLLGFVDWHWHEELQFCAVTEGTVVFHVGEEKLVLDVGDGLFIAPALLHQAKNLPGTDSAYICLDFHPQLLRHAGASLLDRVYLEPYLEGGRAGFLPLRRSVPWQSEILTLIRTIRDDSEAEQAPHLSIYREILRIWELLYGNYLSALPDGARAVQNQSVRAMVEYAGAHYAESVRLEELAAAAGLAGSTCCRVFKKAMGCTIFEYINNLRLLQSERLLLGSESTVTEIAMQCGFGTASYYNRSFKKKTGVSPTAYRRAHTGKI